MEAVIIRIAIVAILLFTIAVIAAAVWKANKETPGGNDENK